MPTTYDKADDSVNDMLAGVMKKYHGDLVQAGVTVGILMASSETGAPVKLHGYPCQAVVKIRNLKDRTMGMPDADIVIDAENWEKLSKPERIALLDHEANHLELKKDKYNTLQRDDAGRPKLAMRLHDHEFGWFDIIAHRHADASAEVKQAKAFADECGQTYFGWAAPPEREVETARLKGEVALA